MINIIYIIYGICLLTNKLFHNNVNKIKYIINKNLLQVINDTNTNNYNKKTLYYNSNYNNNKYDNIQIYYEKRIKSKKRIMQKIKKLKIPYDIYGFRIIYNDTANFNNTDLAYIIKDIIYDNFNTIDYKTNEILRFL